MRKTAFLLLSVFVMLIQAQALAHVPAQKDPKSSTTMADKVSITDAWARATFALAKSGAAYMTITNNSKQQVHLSSVEVSQTVAARSELHHTIMDDEMMSMQELTEGVVIPSNNQVNFVPGGKHIMLMGLTGPLLADNTIELDFIFADQSRLSHQFLVRDASNSPMQNMH